MYLNNNINKYLVLEAGAGSGKTFSLVSRYLSLLFLGVDPSKIVAITFTRKATKEMYDRITSSLKNPLNSSEISFIAENFNLSENQVLELAKSSLSKFLNSDVKIKTIDSLSHSIFKRFSHYLDIVPNFKTVTKFDQKLFCEIFLDELYLNNIMELFENIMLILNRFDAKFEQNKLCEIMELFYIKEIDIKEHLNIITNSQVDKDILEVMINEIIEIAFNIKISLLNSQDISQSGIESLNFYNITELLNTTWIKKDNLADYLYFRKPLKSKSKIDVENLNINFEILKDKIAKLLDEVNNFLLFNLAHIFSIYVTQREEFIKNRGRFSFDDINHFIAKLLVFSNNKVDSHFIYFRLDEKIDHFLIDEFQDTSLLQYKILEPLIREILSGKGIDNEFGKSFFYVGDKNQALYRFRGGFSQIFDHLGNEHEIIKSEKLSKNFRSKSNILDFINSIFNKNQELGLTESQKGGSVVIKNSPKELIYHSVYETIYKLKSLGANYLDIAVICPKNRDIEEIGKILFEHNIPYQAEINIQLIEYRTNRAIINYIKYLYFNEEIYLKSFIAILGYSPSYKINELKLLQIDLFKNSIYKTVTEIIKFFKLYDGDINLLKFLRIVATDFIDIEDFIINYQYIDIKASRDSKNGVTLITIHKSKGLQFPHIIALDFSEMRGRDIKNELIFYYDNLQVKDLYWKFLKKDILGLSNKFKNIQDYEDKAKTIDLYNQLYVSLTRGKESLTIIKYDSDSHSTMSKINIDLNKNLIFNKYNEFSNYSEDNQNISKDYYFEFQDLDELYKLQNERTDKTEEQNLNFHKLELGKALHFTIELMGSFTKESLEIALKITKNKFGSTLFENDFVSIKIRILHLITNDQFISFINSGTIKREIGYLRTNGQSRYIDMLIENYNSAIILDFKSSDNVLLKEKYYKQLTEYKDDYKSISQKHDVKAFLVFLDESITKFEEIS